jgi:hypothetical protein
MMLASEPGVDVNRSTVDTKSRLRRAREARPRFAHRACPDRDRRSVAPRKETLQAGVVLERPAQLGAVISVGLLLPLDLKLFVFGAAIEAVQDMLDARNRALRILRAEIGFVGLLAPDEQIRLAVLICASAAQYLEAFEMTPHARGFVVAPRHNDGIERVPGIFAGTFAREFAVGDIHGKVVVREGA